MKTCVVTGNWFWNIKGRHKLPPEAINFRDGIDIRTWKIDCIVFDKCGWNEEKSNILKHKAVNHERKTKTDPQHVVEFIHIAVCNCEWVKLFI